MATHGSKAAILLNGADVSDWLDQAGFSADVDQNDTTTFGHADKTFMSSPMKNATWNAQGKWDGSLKAVDEKMNAILGGKDDILVYLPMGDGLGNHCYGFKANESKYEVTAPVADVVSLSVEMQSNVGKDGCRVLQPKVTRNATGNGSDYDNGASSANGGVAYLSVAAITGAPNAVVKVQHSSDGITWVDLLTFANVTAGETAQRMEVAAGTTVQRHMRAILSSIAGASDLTYSVAFGRR